MFLNFDPHYLSVTCAHTNKKPKFYADQLSFIWPLVFGDSSGVVYCGCCITGPSMLLGVYDMTSNLLMHTLTYINSLNHLRCSFNQVSSFSYLIFFVLFRQMKILVCCGCGMFRNRLPLIIYAWRKLASELCWSFHRRRYRKVLHLLT